jgi:hypothetical protein
MTVIRGKVYPDSEFPEEDFHYHADRNSVHDYGSQVNAKSDIEGRIERLKTDEQTYRLRVARYKLVEVIEIECVGKRPTKNF